VCEEEGKRRRRENQRAVLVSICKECKEIRSVPTFGGVTFGSKKQWTKWFVAKMKTLGNKVQEEIAPPLVLTTERPEDENDYWCGRRLRATPSEEVY
jgi:hypothetical protein